MLRLPASLWDPETAAAYCRTDSASAHAHGGFVVLSFQSQNGDGEDWDEDGAGWLPSILPVREAIAGGDHRALYLAWLLGIQMEEGDEDEPEPPVPAGLGKLSGALKAFADFLRIDTDLVHVAAERSAAMEDAPGRDELEAWIASLSEMEKTALLARVAGDEATLVRTELRRRFHASRRRQPAPADQPRTAAELLAAAEAYAEKRTRAEAERAARERARREREAAEKRARYLDELATREEAAWVRVDALAATKKPSAYDEAASLLRDLRELAARGGRAAEAERRVQALRERHASKRSFLARFPAPAANTLAV
jgi:hypothetical protein